MLVVPSPVRLLCQSSLQTTVRSSWSMLPGSWSDLLCAVAREYQQGGPTDVSPHFISNKTSQLTKLHGLQEKLWQVPHVQKHWAHIHMVFAQVILALVVP